MPKLTLHDPAVDATPPKAARRSAKKVNRKGASESQQPAAPKIKPYRLIVATLGKMPTSEEFENLQQVALRLQREVYTNPPEDVRFFLTVGQAVDLKAKDTLLVLSHGDESVEIRLPSLAADSAIATATGAVLSDDEASSSEDTSASADAGDDFFFA